MLITLGVIMSGLVEQIARLFKWNIKWTKWRKL